MSESVFALKDPLPFSRICASDLTYTLKVPKELFPRLKDACHSLIDDADLTIRFYRDLQGLNVAEGEVSMPVEFLCERCFKPYQTTLRAKFSSTPDAEKAESLRIAERLDLIELDEDGSFDTLAFIEDCLLLEIPIICEHENEEDCDLKGDEWQYSDEDFTDRENPFASLESLKGSLKQ